METRSEKAESFQVDATPLLGRANIAEKSWSDFDNSKTSFTTKKKIGFFLSILISVVLFFHDVQGKDEAQTKDFVKVNDMLAVLSIMVCWWLTEVVNVAITAMLPILFLPMLGLRTGKTTATKYFGDVSFLFIAAFSLACAMKAVNLHKRLALLCLRLFGTKPLGLLCGFAIPAFFLSLFMSNPGTTALLVPLAEGVIEATLGTIAKEDKESRDAMNHFAKGLILAVGYSATIGGCGTLVGTPPNGVLQQYTVNDFDYNIDFGQWMLAFVPMGLCLLAANVSILYKVYVKKAMQKVDVSMDNIKQEYKKLGKMNYDEMVVATCFVLAVFFVSILPQLINTTHGVCTQCKPVFLLNGTKACKDLLNEKLCKEARGTWAPFFGSGSYFLLGALPLFIIPSKTRPGEALLEWKVALLEIPWGLIMLLGGGIAVADGFKVTKTSEYLASFFSGLASVDETAAVVIIVGTVSFLTEVTSNTATTSILVPIMFEFAKQNKRHPFRYGLAVCMGANLAFMLPIATAPNTIMYGTKKFDGFFGYAKTGFFVNLSGIFLASLFIITSAAAIFNLNVSYDEMDPRWKN